MADHQMLVFRLDEIYFGIDLADVDQIIPLKEVTRIPNMPVYIEGIMPLRDEVCTVLNLRKKFNLPAREADENTRIIIVNAKSELVGLIADNANEILHRDGAKTTEAPGNVKGLDEKYIKEIVEIGEKHIYIIDLNQIV